MALPGRALALLLLLPLGSGGARRQDDVQVSAALSPERVAVGGMAVLEVTVTTGGPEPDSWGGLSLPDGLDVAGTSDRTQMQYSFPGGRSYSMTRSYTLMASRQGVFRIPAVRISVGGRTYPTRPLTLVVTPSASGGAGAGGGIGGTVELPPDAEETGVAFHARMDPDTVWVGQQSTLVAEAGFSGDVRNRMNWSPEYLPPSANGFWVQDLTDASSVRTHITGSRILSEVHTYRRAYFPLHPGDYRLPPATLSYEVRAGFFGQSVSRELQTDSIPLVVRPLPATGQPEAFTGAVGDYVMTATLEPSSVAAGETTVLTVRIEGSGNVRALPAPSLDSIPGVDVYPPTEDARMRDDGAVVGGTKTFSWVLVPRKPGDVVVGPVRYGIFRPTTERYDVLSGPALRLHVTGTAVAGAMQRDGSTPVLGPLRTSPAGDPLDFTRSGWFVLVQLLPMAAGAFLLGRSRVRSAARAPSRRALRARRRAELQRLRALADPLAVLGGLERLLVGWSLERMGLPPGSAAQLESALRRRGHTALAGDVAALQHRLREARYAPNPPAAAELRDYTDGVEQVLEAVDRALPRRIPPVGAGAKRAGTVGLVVLALALPLSRPLNAAQDARQDSGRDAAQGHAARAPAADAFQQAVLAYQQGGFATARRGFATFLQHHPEDAAGWYDYGLAAMRSGAQGEAAWAWLTAATLAPRDADVRGGLAAAGVAPAVINRVVPPVPLSRSETYLLASLLWLVGAGLLLVHRARPRPGLTLAGGAAVLLAVGLLAAGVAPRALAPTAVVVAADGAALRPAPDMRSEALDRLDDGDALGVEERRGDWVRVRTEQGREGWVERRDARFVGPG